MRILFLLFPDQGNARELRMERLAAPYYLFKDLRADVVLASPLGGSPMASIGRSISADSKVERFNADRSAREELADTIGFHQVIVDDFDAAYCLGITGTIWHARSTETLIGQFLHSAKPVAIIPGRELDLAQFGAGAGLLIVGNGGETSLLAARTLLYALRSNDGERTEP